jgi:hypothetical protein
LAFLMLILLQRSIRARNHLRLYCRSGQASRGK